MQLVTTLQCRIHIHMSVHTFHRYEVVQNCWIYYPHKRASFSELRRKIQRIYETSPIQDMDFATGEYDSKSWNASPQDLGDFVWRTWIHVYMSDRICYILSIVRKLFCVPASLQGYTNNAHSFRCRQFHLRKNLNFCFYACGGQYCKRCLHFISFFTCLMVLQLMAYFACCDLFQSAQSQMVRQCETPASHSITHLMSGKIDW